MRERGGREGERARPARACMLCSSIPLRSSPIIESRPCRAAAASISRWPRFASSRSRSSRARAAWHPHVATARRARDSDARPAARYSAARSLRDGGSSRTER